MRALVWGLLVSFSAAAGCAAAQTGSRPLPPDIDEQSLSRLPLILKDTLDEEGRRIFEAINGNEGNKPRLGPPASSMYSLAAAEPYG
jgi:nitrous oxide reductase accessory protein NosL